MENFSDPSHSMSELVFQGATEHALEDACNDKLLGILQRWQTRDDQADPRPELFHLDNTRSFTISYRGEAGHYWPDENANLLGETLVRDFLFHEGICNLPDFSVRLYFAKYKIQAMYDTEYLLVCPYPTAAGNIAGLVVVCVNGMLRPGR